jgi:predicted nucleotidyltransferase
MRPDLLYRVRRVVLFGSMLTDVPMVSDVDLAVELAPKQADGEKQRALERAQILEELEFGRTFSSFLQKLLYPRQRVLSFLKARSRVLQIVDPSDGVLKRAKKKVIFEDPA